MSDNLDYPDSGLGGIGHTHVPGPLPVAKGVYEVTIRGHEWSVTTADTSFANAIHRAYREAAHYIMTMEDAL